MPVPTRKFDASSFEYFRTLSSPVNFRSKEIYDDLVKGCKADISLRGNTSNWDEIATLWIYHTFSREAAYTNIRRPGLNTNEPVAGVHPAFSPFGGIQSISYNNSVNGMLNLKWNASDDHYDIITQNSLSVGAWIGTNKGDANSVYGGLNASSEGISMSPRLNTNGRQSRVNSVVTNSPATGVTTSAGLHVDVRRNSTQFVYWRDGVARNTLSRVSVAPVAVDLYALAVNNNNGVPDRRTTRQVKLIFTGSGEIDQLKLYNRLNQFLTDMGQHGSTTFSSSDTLGFSNGDTLGFNTGDELGIGYV